MLNERTLLINRLKACLHLDSEGILHLNINKIIDLLVEYNYDVNYMEFEEYLERSVRKEIIPKIPVTEKYAPHVIANYFITVAESFMRSKIEYEQKMLDTYMENTKDPDIFTKRA
jgi:peptidoglycan hydrolase-like amidase